MTTGYLPFCLNGASKQAGILKEPETNQHNDIGRQNSTTSFLRVGILYLTFATVKLQSFREIISKNTEVVL